MAYKIQRQIGSRIHPIFRVSILKPFKGLLPSTPQLLPPLNFGNKRLILPIAILRTPSVQLKRKSKQQVLVQ